ncbi:putative transposase IS605 OrfB [Mycobacterium xenopi 4042]|uniref:Putative transposase IS605 OrfB n=1 Tax=Mycobacterium xenopi 4042 TaxID=1299334 RepID=X8DBF0_MYCXE|nr:putative transposase IS605 OrfB [Mycobacterium xenopi 4042]
MGHGADIACERLDYVSWQKNFPRSVRDRAPGHWWRWCAARLKAPAVSSSTSTTHARPPCRKPACAEPQEETAFATGAPLRVRHQRRSGPVFGLPGTACPNRGRWGRSAGLAVSRQGWGIVRTSTSREVQP